MNDKKDRFEALRKMPLWAMEDHRNSLNTQDHLDFIKSLPRNERRKIKASTKKLASRYKKIMMDLSNSGAGFPVDQLLRQMAIEYNNRYSSAGVFNQPVSFNYFEPFCKIELMPESVAPFIVLPEEVDHLFYSSDFFDYLTSSDSDGFSLESLYELTEAKTFHFSTNGNINDISFFDVENREYIISGFSMVRHGHSLYWYIVGGEIFSETEWEEFSNEKRELSVEECNQQKRAFLREYIERDNYQMGLPISLEDTDACLKTIIAGEIDLKTQKHISRCYLAEFENTFSVYCDDPEILETTIDKDIRENLINEMLYRINKASVLWNLAEGFFQLPSYFSFKLSVEKETVKKSQKPFSKKKGGKGIGKNYKIVSSIEIDDSKPTASILRINLPHYGFETEGHWRRLNSASIGLDQFGNEIKGKTWVKATNKWRAPKESLKTVFVKDKISSARQKIEEYLRAIECINKANGNKPEMKKDNSGELYVMRCSAMKNYVFKVGYTDLDSITRAKQLSKATGIPMSFVVVKSWNHIKARELETEVHIMLAPYRLNDAREFFVAQFEVIERIIEAVIKRIGKSSL